MLRAVASGSRLLPTRPVKDFHLQSSAHAGHTSAATAFDASYAANERDLDCAPIRGEDPAPIDTLRRAVLSERRTGATLGYLEFAPNVLDHGTPARGA